jgi:hypothetical protein
MSYIDRMENMHTEQMAEAVWQSSASLPSSASRHASVLRCSQGWALMSRYQYYKV